MSTVNKHTQGEWAVDGFNLNAVICKDEKGRWKKIADTTQETSYPSDEEIENAKLIVKAVNNHQKLIDVLNNLEVEIYNKGMELKIEDRVRINQGIRKLLKSIEQQTK